LPINDALKDYFWSPQTPALSGKLGMGLVTEVLASPLDPVAYRVDCVSANVQCGVPDFYASVIGYIGKPPSDGGTGTPFITAAVQPFFDIVAGIPVPLVTFLGSDIIDHEFFLRTDGGEESPDISIWIETIGETADGNSWGSLTVFYSAAYLF